MRWLALAVFVLLSTGARADEAVDVARRARVGSAIRHGIEYLTLVQHDDGRWRWPVSRKNNGAARDALATATALHALAAHGVSKDDPAVVRGLAWTAKHHAGYRPGRPYATEAASMLLLALAYLDPDAHRERIAVIGRRLERAQNATGWWNDRLERSSLVRQPHAAVATQAAIAALWQAGRLGAYEASPRVWERTHERCARTQAADGSWGTAWRLHETATCLFGLVVSAKRIGVDAKEPARSGLAALRRVPQYSRIRQHGPGGRYLPLIGDAAAVTDAPRAEWCAPRVDDLLARQGPNGGWDAPDGAYGTAMVLLFLRRAAGNDAAPRATTPTRRDRKAATAPEVAFPGAVNAANLREAFEAYLTTPVDERVALRPRFGEAGRVVLDFLIDRLADPDAQVRATAYELLTVLATPPPFDVAAGPIEREAGRAAIAEWLKREGAKLAWNAEHGRFE